jgi:NAD(P)-dependent dehydrogenase (short-subunit alcohol dehydrogenase family)
MTAQRFSVDPSEFATKRVLVTGGTKGMGQAIVQRLTAGGATVATHRTLAVARRWCLRK